MNNCINEETLSTFCDGVLDKAAQQDVEKHLQECWNCRRTVSDYRNLNSGIKGLPDLELPIGFHTALAAKLKSEDAPKVGKVRQQWVKVAAAAVLLIAIAAPGYGLYFLGSKDKRNLIVTQGVLTDQAAFSPKAAQKSKMELGAPKSAASDSEGSQSNGGSGLSGSTELRRVPNMNVYNSSGEEVAQPPVTGSANTPSYYSSDATTGAAGSSSAAKSIYPTILIEIKAVDAVQAGRGILLKALESPSLEINTYWSSTRKVSLEFSAMPGDALNFVAQLGTFGVISQASQNWDLTDSAGKSHVMISISSP